MGTSKTINLSDTHNLYQYTGVVDFSAVNFNSDGVSENIIESQYWFSYDTNYKYMKRPDNYWIRTKIHKEVSAIELGSLPE